MKASLAAAGIYCQSFNADTLREPWEMLDSNGKVRCCAAVGWGCTGQWVCLWVGCYYAPPLACLPPPPDSLLTHPLTPPLHMQPFTSFDGFWGVHCGLPYPPAPPLPPPATLPPLPAAIEGLPLSELGIMTPEEEMSNAQLGFHVSVVCVGWGGVGGLMSRGSSSSSSTSSVASCLLPLLAARRSPPPHSLPPTHLLILQWQPGCPTAHRLLEEFIRGGRLRSFDHERAKVCTIASACDTGWLLYLSPLLHLLTCLWPPVPLRWDTNTITEPDLAAQTTPAAHRWTAPPPPACRPTSTTASCRSGMSTPWLSTRSRNGPGRRWTVRGEGAAQDAAGPGFVE